MKRLLVIIVSYNGMRWLERCLDSVMSSTVQADIFVCDNGSTDGSADFVGSHYGDRVHLVRNVENLGFARANNLGFKYALDNDYDFVYLLNQDAWVLPDTFGMLIDASEYGNWGILSPMQMKPDLVRPDRRFRRHYHGTMEPVDEVCEVRFVMAAHWLVSSGCLRKTGLFSPAFTHYGEDNNYCDRARYHGFRIGVLPSALAVHDREVRKRTKEQRIYLNCQYSKVRLSDPASPYAFQCVWQPLRQVLMSVRWMSLLPVRNISSLKKEYPSLKRWREESLGEGAFMG